MSSCPARKALAYNLKRLRADRRWSQEELAYQAGLHRTFIAHVEREARNIAIDNIQRLADALEVEPSLLLIAEEKLIQSAALSNSSELTQGPTD